jgi:hypothetical protein
LRFNHQQEEIPNRFEVLTAVVVKTSVFSDMTSRSLLNIDRCFGGTCLLSLQGLRMGRAINQNESRKQQLNFNGFHGAISQKTVLFRESYWIKFSDTVNKSHYIVSNRRMLSKRRREAVVAYFSVLSRNSLEGTTDYHNKYLSE